ncbi:MAG: PorV/PorQ family protein [Balneolaceae bacterium]|nr:PorV/PorQ family protein [Balneolaceae bacterium]
MKRPIFVLIILFFAADLTAQDTGSGLDFLNIGPSSRLLSISEASTAVTTGPSAIYTNPSLLVLEEVSSLDLSYTLWIADVYNQFAAVNFRRNRSAFALGVYNSTSDGFLAFSGPGDSAGEFSIGYLSIAGAAAYKFGPFSIGATGQYLREEIFQHRANGYALSGGITAEFLDRRLRTAFAVKNLGNMESLDEISTTLPATINAGLSADLIEFVTPGANDLPVLLSLYADWSKPIEDNPTSDYNVHDPDEGFISVALNADIAELFYIQGGYRFGATERPISFGLGMAIEPVRINYAIVPFSTGFGTVHSFGLQYYF